MDECEFKNLINYVEDPSYNFFTYNIRNTIVTRLAEVKFLTGNTRVSRENFSGSHPSSPLYEMQKHDEMLRNIKLKQN